MLKNEWQIHAVNIPVRQNWDKRSTINSSVVHVWWGFDQNIYAQVWRNLGLEENKQYPAAAEYVVPPSLLLYFHLSSQHIKQLWLIVILIVTDYLTHTICSESNPWPSDLESCTLPLDHSDSSILDLILAYKCMNQDNQMQNN